MRVNAIATHAACGQELQRLRVEQGIATQNELARLLGLTQQTVSRWEAGRSRPRADQIAALSTALRADPGRLMRVAGYVTEQVTASFDQPLPLGSLSPESFQRFCRSLLEALYPGAEVHAAGKAGHKQQGIDIALRFADGRRHSFQCKRESTFGAAKVRRVVAEHSVEATQRYILLSRVASPPARREVERHEGWDIWDQDDLSEKLRGLPKERQRQIVDTYFAGQRLALIGEPLPGPWLTADDFFAPLVASAGPVSQRWELVGRESERKDLACALADRSKIVVALTAPAGGGKSRLLRAALADFAASGSTSPVYMLSPTENATRKSLDDLGPAAKLLVVDDAHDRSDLALLAHFVADERSNARLLLVYRPYAQELIDRELARQGLIGPSLSLVRMPRPTKADAVALATQVLEAEGSHTAAAQRIAEVAYDSPLAVVVGAWLVARRAIHPELLGSHDVFRTTVLQHYKAVVAGGLSINCRDQGSIDGLLRLIALVQPVVPDDPRMLALAQAIEGISAPDATRLAKLLITAGVLNRRGSRYRLSPDLLADSIIETDCVTTNGTSNGTMERVFAAASPEHQANLLQNVGRLDWRRNEGDTTDSRLVDALWNEVTYKDDYRQAQLRAAVEAAYYQPRQALDLAERLMAAGHGADGDVCRLIRNAGYNLKHLRRACELLWEIGQHDARPTNQSANHPIRLLAEMAAPEPRKPVQFCEVVVGFALSLAVDDDSWSRNANPFEIVKGALTTEGHVTSMTTSRAVTLAAFGVDPGAVAAMRSRIVDAILEGLVSGNKRHAYESARLLQTALHGPIGRLHYAPSDGDRAEWARQFEDTLARIDRLVSTHRLSAVVLVRVGESVAWHAQYARERTKELAQRVLRHLSRDLQTRTVRLLMDGWGHRTWRGDNDVEQLDAAQEALVQELKRTYPDASDLAEFLDRQLSLLKGHGDDASGSAQILVNRLVAQHLPLAREILAISGRASVSSLSSNAPFALATLLEREPTEAHAYVDSLLAAGDENLTLIAQAYATTVVRRSYSEQDRCVIRRIFTSGQLEVLACASWIFREVAKQSTELAIDLLTGANSALLDAAGRDIFMWLDDEKLVPLASISVDDLEKILRLLEAPDRLDEHFVHAFLARVARRSPQLVVELAKRRLEKATTRDAWGMAPIGGLPGHTPSLDILGHELGPVLLHEVLDWALPQIGTPRFAHNLADLVEGVFGLGHHGFPAVLEAWSSGGQAEHFRLVASVLREVPTAFVFERSEFVRRLLKGARAIGSSAHRDVCSSLYLATLSGVRSGTPGEPFEEDLRMKERAENVLQGLGTADPAYRLYHDLKRHAELEIDRATAEGRAMDEEDADS